MIKGEARRPTPTVQFGDRDGLRARRLHRGVRTLHTGQCAEPGQAVDQNGQNPWNGTDPNATIGLEPGQNVLTITPEELAALDNINPLSGALQPGDEAWLIINVEVDGDYTWDLPQVSWQGNDGAGTGTRHHRARRGSACAGCRSAAGRTHWCGGHASGHLAGPAGVGCCAAARRATPAVQWRVITATS